MAERQPAANPQRVGAIFARRLREARNARGWTQQDLADELGKLDMPLDRTTLAKIEKGQREVRLDELVAIAAALDVAIVHLIFPIEGDPSVASVAMIDGKKVGRRRKARGPLVALTPTLQVPQVKARRWARGAIPLDPANFRSYRDQTAGDLAVSAEELSKVEQETLRQENLRMLRKLGVPVEAGEPPNEEMRRLGVGPYSPNKPSGRTSARRKPTKAPPRR